MVNKLIGQRAVDEISFIATGGLLLLLLIFLSFHGAGTAADYMAKMRVRTTGGKKVRSRGEHSEMRKRQQLNWMEIGLAMLIVLALTASVYFYLGL